MVCTIFSNLQSIGDFLVWPTSCFYHFYLVVIGAIFIVLTLSIYFGEKERVVKPDMISSIGVSSIAITFLAMIGTLIKDNNNIPMVQQDIFLYIIAFSVVFIVIWFFKK